MSTALRLVGFLGVLSSTPAQSFRRASCIHARLRLVGYLGVPSSTPAALGAIKSESQTRFTGSVDFPGQINLFAAFVSRAPAGKRRGSAARFKQAAELRGKASRGTTLKYADLKTAPGRGARFHRLSAALLGF